MSEIFTIQIPATTSNCGPGFDTLGIALTLFNYIEIEKNDTGKIFCKEECSSETLDMVNEVAEIFANEANTKAIGFSFDIWGEVPETRGLGSSATIRCGILAGLNKMHGDVLNTEELIKIASKLDRAPDGISAAFKGGFAISRIDPETNEYVFSYNKKLPEDLVFVVAVPQTRTPTALAREALPTHLPFDQAVKTLNSLSIVTTAFITENFDMLKGSVSDYIHEPYRERLCPFTKEAIEAGTYNGAYCGWLSGSGSSVVCVSAREKAMEVANAMTAVYENNNEQVRILKLRTSNTGIIVSEGSSQLNYTQDLEIN